MEAWHCLTFKQDWNTYRFRIFQCINSMLIFLIFSRGTDSVSNLLRTLEEACKPGHRKQLDAAKEKLMSVMDVEPLHCFLDMISRETLDGYLHFYGRAYVSLVQFIAGVTDNITHHETILLDLLTDFVGRGHDGPQLSAAEKHDYNKVISIVTSCFVESYVPSKIGGVRSKYVDAAFFLGSRIRYLMDVDNLTRQQEAEFWHQSPIPTYMLSQYCDDDDLRKYANIMPRVHLPKLQSNAHEYGDAADAEEEDHETPPLEAPTVVVEMTSTSSTPSTLKRRLPAKVADMKLLLQARGISYSGKKREAIEELLINTGEYRGESPRKNQRKKQRRDEEVP